MTPRVDKQKLLTEFQLMYERNKNSRLHKSTKNWYFWINPWNYSIQYQARPAYGEIFTLCQFEIKNNEWRVK